MRAERQAGLVSEKEMGIMVGKGKSFQKSPIQEYGRGPHFACFVLPATNALPTLCTSYLWPSLPSPLSLPCASSPVSYSTVFSLCLGQDYPLGPPPPLWAWPNNLPTNESSYLALPLPPSPSSSSSPSLSTVDISHPIIILFSPSSFVNQYIYNFNPHPPMNPS